MSVNGSLGMSASFAVYIGSVRQKCLPSLKQFSGVRASSGVPFGVLRTRRAT
jgi:hypothetical protein